MRKGIVILKVEVRFFERDERVRKISRYRLII